ncbi:MAG: hypothetical protein ACR2I7_01110 [Geodermatophilaceae bacterium]
MDHRYLPPADAQETRQPPQQARIADGWLPRTPDSLEQLDLLLVQVAKARVVHRDGIRFQACATSTRPSPPTSANRSRTPFPVVHLAIVSGCTHTSRATSVGS